MNLGAKIKKLRHEQGKTLEEVAKYVGVSRATVSKWESGIIENMRRDKLAKIAQVLNVSPLELMGWKDNTLEVPNRPIRVPVYGNVAAGIPIEAITDIEDYEELDPMHYSDAEYIALRINGYSMEPKISKGDVVIVRLQPSCDDGDIIIAMVNGDEATCKKFKKTTSGIVLLSTNPAFEPLYYTAKEVEELPVRILGKVVELRAKFN